MKSTKRPSWLPSEVGIDPGPPRNLAPEGAKTLVVMLGSGGVTPNPHRHGPSAAVIAKDSTYVIDAGEGVEYVTRFIGTRQGPDGIGEIGEVLLETERNPDVYRFRGDELYVRAKITSTRLKENPYADGDVECAWIQPIRPRS